MNPTTTDPNQQIKDSLAAYHASQYSGGAAPAPAAPDATAVPAQGPAPVAPSANPTNDAIAASLAKYQTTRDAGGSPLAIPKDPNKLAEFAKGIFSAPATILARPVQAAAELGGATSEQVDAATKKIPLVGGLVAPVPQNGADVAKDVGRGAQTVALGLDAPLAAGALFGAGTSVEQGNDLLSAQTAFDTVLGAAGGKVLDLVGRPLLDGAGKVVGTITPQVIKDVAAGGAKSIADFAANHNLPTSAVTKPLSEGIQKGARAFDNTINAGASKAANALKTGATEQFPGLNPVDHFTAVNEKDFLRPTTVNEPRFAKAQSVYNDALSRLDANKQGINLEKVATDQGIIHDKIAEGGKYNTTDVVDNLREGNYRASDSLVRPAIKAAEPGVRFVPVSEVRNAMLDHIQSLPKNSIDDADRATLVKQINKRYGPGSPTDLAHPNGFSLTDLHDARIIAQKNGQYKIGGTSSDALSAQRSREEGRVFDQIFNKTAPEDLNIKPFKRELEKNFLLADYLEQLHGKKVPEGITKKAVRLFGRGLGGVIGSKVGGFPGFLVGSRGGDMIFNGFETLQNPIKIKVLESVKREDPAVYTALTKYIGDKETEALSRLALPPGGGSSFSPKAPTLFTTPGGKTSSNKGEAFDVAAVEAGKAKTGSGLKGKRLKDLIQTAQENQGPYTPPDQLPVIKK